MQISFLYTVRKWRCKTTLGAHSEWQFEVGQPAKVQCFRIRVLFDILDTFFSNRIFEKFNPLTDFLSESSNNVSVSSMFVPVSSISLDLSAIFLAYLQSRRPAHQLSVENSESSVP